jgi:hypothetical protein
MPAWVGGGRGGVCGARARHALGEREREREREEEEEEEEEMANG